MKEFSPLLERLSPTIDRASRYARIPGMDADDVRSEMMVCLWKAHERHDESKGEIEGYWWSIWLNRRKDLIKYWSRRKPVLTAGSLDDIDVPQKFTTQQPDPPLGSSSVERRVWAMIGDGAERKEILAVCGISKSTYYAIIHSWKSSPEGLPIGRDTSDGVGVYTQ